MGRASVVLALLAAAAPWETVRGDRFDVLAPDRPRAERAATWAESTGRRFAALFGEFPGKRAAVVLVDRAGGEALDAPWRENGAAWGFLWPHPVPTLEDLRKHPPGSLTPERVRSFTREDEFRRELALEALRELVRRRTGSTARYDGYGSPLPDWIDAAVETHHESDAAKAERRKRMADLVAFHASTVGKGGTPAYPDILLPLRDLLEKDLPGLGRHRYVHLPPDLEGLSEADRKRIEESLRAQGLVSIEENDRDHCLLVLEFLLDRYGPAFFRHCVDVQLRGQRFKAALPWLRFHAKELRDPGPRIPDSIQELQDAWWAWLRARPPEK